MRGPHPYPERHNGDLVSMREILAALEVQHRRAVAAAWTTVSCSLAMAIGRAREDIQTLESAGRWQAPDGDR